MTATSNAHAAQLRQLALIRNIARTPQPGTHGINKECHCNNYGGLAPSFLGDVAQLTRARAPLDCAAAQDARPPGLQVDWRDIRMRDLTVDTASKLGRPGHRSN
jgi:hypothetical protein